MRLNALRQQHIEAQKAVNALEAEKAKLRATKAGLLKIKAEGKTLTEEQAKELTAAEAQDTALEARLAASRDLVTIAAEEVAAEEARIAAEDKALKAKPSGRTDITVDKPNASKDTAKGFRSPREFLHAAIQDSGKRSKDDVNDERLKGLAVFDKTDKMAAGELAFMLPEAFTPPALRGGPVATAGSDEQAAYDDRYGGFAVGRTTLPGILSIGFEGDPTAGRTQAIPMATPTVDMLARTDKDHTSSVSGGFTVTRRPEAVAASSSRSTMEMVSLKATSLFGLAYATEEILSDSVISFLAVIETGFRDQFGAHMLNEKLRGGGGNEFLGILTALASSSLGPTITVNKEAGQLADTIVTENVIKMAARNWGFGGSIWLANHDTRPQLFTLSISVGTGGVLLYQPSRGEGFPDMLLGRPVFYTEYASKLGDVGDIILANFSQYLEGLYQPLQSAESMHVRFVNHERTFKFWLRNAGAPWWKSALTPNKSSDTLSPFVVLQAR